MTFLQSVPARPPTRTTPELVHAKEAGEAEAKDHENAQEARQAHLQKWLQAKLHQFCVGEVCESIVV